MGTIRTEQTRLLQDNGTENIEFFVYDKDGNPKSTLRETKDVLKQIPSNVTPVNSDLSVEYLRPLKEAIKTTKTKAMQLLNKNPNFRYNSFNWDVTASKATVQIPSQIYTNVNPISGLYCLYQAILATSISKTTHMIKNILNDTRVVSGRDLDISWNYYIATYFNPLTVQYISVGLDSTNDGSVNKMYNFEENKFETGTFTNDKFFRRIEYTQNNAWNKYKTTIQLNLTSSETNPHIEFKMFEAQTISTLQGSFFVDGLSIQQKANSTKRIHKRNRISIELSSLTDLYGVTQTTNDLTNITGEYKQKETILSNELDSLDVSAIEFIYARKERPLSLYNTNTLDSNVLQEILNDFREPLKRYEGTFYKDDSDVVPLYFFNKLWINFGTTVLQEPVSAIIDSMEYNVKKNQYTIIMHIPNQDDDVFTTNLYNIE